MESEQDTERRCRNMSINELENYIYEQKNQLEICEEILEEKFEEYILENRPRRLKIKENILSQLERLKPGFVLDVSKINLETGSGIRTIRDPRTPSQHRPVGARFVGDKMVIDWLDFSLIGYENIITDTDMETFLEVEEILNTE